MGPFVPLAGTYSRSYPVPSRWLCALLDQLSVCIRSNDGEFGKTALWMTLISGQAKRLVCITCSKLLRLTQHLGVLAHLARRCRRDVEGLHLDALQTQSSSAVQELYLGIQTGMWEWRKAGSGIVWQNVTHLCLLLAFSHTWPDSLLPPTRLDYTQLSALSLHEEEKGIKESWEGVRRIVSWSFLQRC